MSNLEKFGFYIIEVLKTNITDTHALNEKIEFIKESLEASSPKLDGKVFYSLINNLDFQLESICRDYFKDSRAIRLGNLEKSDNLFKNLISPIINSQNQVSESAKITVKRFNRLFSGELTDLYAHEIYDLSIALDIEVSSLFEYFYNNGKLPIIGSKNPHQ